MPSVTKICLYELNPSSYQMIILSNEWIYLEHSRNSVREEGHRKEHVLAGILIGGVWEGLMDTE